MCVSLSQAGIAFITRRNGLIILKVRKGRWVERTAARVLLKDRTGRVRGGETAIKSADLLSVRYKSSCGISGSSFS